MHVLSDRLFRKVGGSTGTNFFGLCFIAANMLRDKRQGSLVSLICDSGDRYSATYFNRAWLKEHGLNIDPYREMLERFLDTGDYRCVNQ
jgi:cysteine synthase A